uniref:Uncharacterized protein n=1 Tax=Arundo donax TaxID=35708 RepID=A0A0A9CDX3_ARUDO
MLQKLANVMKHILYDQWAWDHVSVIE